MNKDMIAAWFLIAALLHLQLCQGQLFDEGRRTSASSPLLTLGQETRQRRRFNPFKVHHQPRGLRKKFIKRLQDANEDADEVEGDDDDEEVPMLNVSEKDSPYALISKFFPHRELNHRRMRNDFERRYFNGGITGEELIAIGKVQPKDVWLSDGNLLVLKGGGGEPAKDDNPWEPLDDYQAPYREPKLPPPGFIPEENGVGVPLEDEDLVQDNEIQGIDDDYYYDDDEAETESDATETPPPSSLGGGAPILFKDFVFPDFDEDFFINEMENFQAVRSTPKPPSLTFATPKTPTTPTTAPRLILSTHSPDSSFSYSYISSPTPTPTPTPTPGPIINVKHRSYAENEISNLPFNNKADYLKLRLQKKSKLRTKLFNPFKARSKSSSSSSLTSAVKAPPPPRTPQRRHISLFTHPPNPADIRSLRPLLPNNNNNNFYQHPIQVMSKEKELSPYFNNPPQIQHPRTFPDIRQFINSNHLQSPLFYPHPRPQRPQARPTPQIDRVGKKYVSFYRGNNLGQTWGYSYRLRK